MRGTFSVLVILSLVGFVLLSVVAIKERDDNYGTLIAIFAVLPVLWLLDRLFGGPSTDEWPPLCRKCGYDLRATPDRCPECGTEPDREPSDL